MKNNKPIQAESTESTQSTRDLIRYINLKLATIGQPVFDDFAEQQGDEILSDPAFLELTENLISNYRSRTRLVSSIFAPADQRIQDFINAYVKDLNLTEIPQLPNNTFISDKPGLARVLSLPPHHNHYKNDYIQSYRIKQGVLHNPKNDRRTTKGSFHIVEGGLPVPVDKIEVPKQAWVKFLQSAFNPGDELNQLPFTSFQEKKAGVFVSLLLRPVVSPEVKGVLKRKTMEVRFFAPGSLVSNIDFVESIFGNAGNPANPECDAALDPEHWTGHTGCIVLAPQLTQLTKKELGLPHYDKATERQRKDGVCWKTEDELYNGGNSFKITCRDERGVVITLIADNYFGYSKKEIKTQISYSANLHGLVEEEHSGGAIAFRRKNIGSNFNGALFMKNRLKKAYYFSDVVQKFGEIMNLQPEGYGIDKKFDKIIYIPEDTEIDLYQGSVQWMHQGKKQSITLRPEHFYIFPSGHKIHMEKHPSAPSWRLVSTHAQGTFCHKPSTVSGGGKSEISKSLLNAIIYGSFFVDDFDKDIQATDEIINRDYSNRWKNPEEHKPVARPLLSPMRTLGSVIKLLTPSSQYTEEYNQFVKSIPAHVKALVFYVKRFYRPERHSDNWKDYFSTDVINGRKGHELLFNNRKLSASYLRVGFADDNSWYLHKLRSDFVAAAKIQMEDDITASITLPVKNLKYLNPEYSNKSVKLTENCEEKFFQRPDEAIHRGYDKETEADLSQRNNFCSNYEPLSTEDGKRLVEDAINFDLYTKPIRKLILEGSKDESGYYFITPSHPRMVDGAPSKNPRYLQIRPDLVNPVDDYLAEIGLRFSGRIPLSEAVHHPINAVLPGRRNNPPEKENGIRGLSVYGPIHYQELPELFMDFICSLTGKSPSTTGAGSEGALTKGPFNMLSPVTDLNNALLSYILSGYNAFSSAAGHVGTEARFDHDISLLIPELWSRMDVKDRDPKKLIAEGSLEKVEDFEYNGKQVMASRLGYRITENFTFSYLNSIFDEPQAVFTDKMLRPEKQDMDAFVDGVNNIVEAQTRVALDYFADGSVDAAIPPLKALLHIMAYGNYQGKTVSHPDIRKMFERDEVIQADWYKERLLHKQEIEIQYLERSLKYMDDFMKLDINREYTEQLDLNQRKNNILAELEYAKSDDYLEFLEGTIGADILFTKA
ncbi:MAG: hypothetical protein H6541_13590 [Lentimicrobiaceae bacterium]|nr:hypothetical protein [Lentimicrobiaceae bacterium]HPG32419.1 hypothetical protein [Lentimicrobium sp.]